MALSVISVILGVIIIIGLIFYKPSSSNPDKPFNPVLSRGITVTSLILKWTVPVLLIAMGIYYLKSMHDDNIAEEKAKEELKKIEQEQINRLIHWNQLLDIVNTPYNERELKVLALDFDPAGTNEFGRKYNRDYNEEIELWEDGTVRYIPAEKENYLRVVSEFKNDGLQFIDESKNNAGDMITNYSKGNLYSSVGYFTSSKKYLCAIWDITKTIQKKDFITAEYLVGSWGRLSTLNEGKYTFYNDNTFVFEESNYGKIYGNWSIEDKNIKLNYDKQESKYGIPHTLSMKTEIIHITNKKTNVLKGYLDNEYQDIILSRRE